MKKVVNVVVHAGGFHADDVMCLAMLKLSLMWAGAKGVELHAMRRNPTAEELADPKTFVFDVGMQYDESKRNFDHHQLEGVAACELFRQYLAKQSAFWCDDQVKDLIRQISEADCYGLLACGEHNSFSAFVSSFNPVWDDSEADTAAQMMAACKATASFLSRIHARWEADQRARLIVEEAEVIARNVDFVAVSMDSYAPWKPWALTGDDMIIGAVYPSLRGGYNLESLDSEQWPLPADLSEEEGCTFLHKSRFLAAFETRKQAEQAARLFLRTA